MKQLKKKGLALTLVLAVLLSLGSLSALAYESSDIIGSWYGTSLGTYRAAGSSVLEPVLRYVDLTIDSCDAGGDFTGDAKFTTVEGQGLDDHWCVYEVAGTLDFATGAFTMQTTRVREYYPASTTWNAGSWSGTIGTNEDGEVSISGFAGGDENRPFVFNRTSQWARDEMTEANIAGLIPDTLKEADMSKSISRAEFAAVSVKLYETLTGTSAPTGSIPFTDVAGNVNLTNINKAYQQGIAVGVSATEFSPNVSINREELATMLCRVIKKYRFADWTFETDNEYHMDTDGVKKFADDDGISDFAKESVYYMAKMGIIAGVDDTHFAPRNITAEQEAQGYATATREQAIALSLRIYKLSDMWQ